MNSPEMDSSTCHDHISEGSDTRISGLEPTPTSDHLLIDFRDEEEIISDTNKDSSSNSSNFLVRNGNDKKKIGKSNFYSVEMPSPDNLAEIYNAFATGSTSLAAREAYFRLQMMMLEDHYTELHNFSIYIASWNVNGMSCNTSLREHWLADTGLPPDIYVIGFQELDLSKEAFVFSDSVRETEWLQACTEALHPLATYVKIKLVRLIGMMCILFVRKELEPFVQNVCAETVGTGLLHKMGNKGAVAIRMDFHNTSICFVNCHLAAHADEVERRNQDYREICNRMTFNQFLPPKFIKDHDHIYWFGDLNYRINDFTPEQAKKLLEQNNLPELLAHDQLKQQRELKNVFVNFQEGEINFPPTYKYTPETDDWDASEKNRCPSWCDRILWRGNGIKLLKYRSHFKLRTSDHKPISALFSSPVKVTNPEKKAALREEVTKRLDRLENEAMPQVAVDKSEIDFGMVSYKCPTTQYLTIANTGPVPLTFEFRVKPNDTEYCKKWLKIRPDTSMILPGDACEVELKVFVDADSASKFNSGADKLYEILVLHYSSNPNSGRDLFITVYGTYV